MATRPNRELKIGDIIDKTIGVLSLSAIPALIFIVVIAGLSAGLDVFARQVSTPGVIPNMGMVLQTVALALLLVVIAFVGTYLLVETMLKRTGLMSYSGDKRILAFVGMSLLSSLGTVAGFIMLIIPGLIFMARWVVAAPLLIGKGEKSIASLGKSWEMTKGHEFPIIISLLLVMIVFYGIAYTPTFMFGGQLSAPLALVSRLASTAGSTITAAMGVAIYGILSKRDVSGTFS